MLQMSSRGGSRAAEGSTCHGGQAGRWYSEVDGRRRVSGGALWNVYFDSVDRVPET